MLWIYVIGQINPATERKVGNYVNNGSIISVDDLQIIADMITESGKCIGLRYFNVFGPRQDPNGAYAAVIPRWFSALAKGERPVIFGDGQTSRDFCYIENVVAANILAALTEDERAFKEAFNIACGERTTLNELFRAIRELAPGAGTVEPIYEDFRPGDIAHSLASIEKAESLLGYEPVVKDREGLKRAARWYLKK